MPTGDPTARVFIWYPVIEEGGRENIGHASMYIGNFVVADVFEQSLNDDDGGVIPSALQDDPGQAGTHHNDNYVSWWPTGHPGLYEVLFETQSAKPKLRFYNDVLEEGEEPHLVYDVYGLNVGAMKARWQEIRNKPGATYRWIRESCATMVMAVLEAGGALSKLNAMNYLWYGSRLYWTPKRVAMVCSRLRDMDLAVKTKAGHCPKKQEGLLGAFLSVTGLR